MKKHRIIRTSVIILAIFIMGVFFVHSAVPSAAVGDDNYEENDTYEEAYDLSTYEQTWLSEIDGPGIQSDSDWYKIYVSPGFERLIINLTFIDFEGDIDIKVYQASGELIAEGVSVTNNEFINQIVSTDGVHYLGIYYGDAGNSYDLWWDDVDPDSFGDNYEPNDELAYAYDLIEFDNIWLSTINGSGTQTDDDWYRIRAFSGRERLLLDLRFDDSAGDIDLELYDASETRLTYTMSYTDNEFIDYTVAVAGDYYVRIHRGNTGNEYDFRYESRDPTNTEDDYEENDFRQTAFNLTAYEQIWLSTINGSGIQLDEDWYEIAVTPGNERLVVDVRFQDNQGDIDVEIYNEIGEDPIESSRSVTDNEYLDFIVPSAGIYYILIDDYSGPGNFYDLWWAELDSGDIASPIITAVTHTPDRPDENNNILIYAEVIDDTGIALVNVIYQFEGQEVRQSADMLPIGDDLYEANLGQHELHTDIEYFIIAIDVSSNRNLAINDNFEENYRIVVRRRIPGFPNIPTILISSFGVLWVYFSILRKKRHSFYSKTS